VPTYAYACTACGHEFDAVQKFSESSLTDCPDCAGRLRKKFGAVGVVFKGSGFYRTDSRSSSGSPASGSSGSSDSSSEKGAAASSDTSSSDKGSDKGSSSSTAGTSSSSGSDSSRQKSSVGSSGSSSSSSAGSSSTSAA